MNTVKLLIVSTATDTIRCFLLPFVSHFRGLGWEVDGLAGGISLCPECSIFHRRFEIRWSRNPLSPQNLAALPEVRNIILRGSYDIVHVHTPVAAFVTRLAVLGIPKAIRPSVIYTAHGFHFYRGGHFVRNLLFLFFEKVAGTFTDYLVVINREDEEAARRWRIVKESRIRYMPGIGLDTGYYKPECVPGTHISEIREELGLRSSDKLFLMIGEFSRRKRQCDALYALSQLNRPDVHLAFAGVGALMGDARELAKTLGIDDRVHFLGYREDVPALICSAVAVLLPSQHEGLPRCVMESLSLGIPVIGSDIRGNRDLLMEGGGLLVGVGDTEGIARAMAWMLDNPDHTCEMGKRAIDEMDAYDIRHILAMHEELYTEALALRRG